MSARNDWAPHFRRAKELSSAEAERKNNIEALQIAVATVVVFISFVWCVQMTLIGWLS